MRVSAKAFERCLGALFWLPLVVALFVERSALPSLATIAPILALAVIGEELVVNQRQRPEGALLSFSAVAHVAAVFVLGPLPAGAIAAIGVLVSDGTRREGRRYLLVNSAMFGGSTVLAGYVFILAGGHPGEIGTSTLPALVAAVAMRYLVTSTVFSLGTSLSSKAPFSVVFRETVVEEISSAAQEGSLGILIAYSISNHQWIVLPFLLPLFAAIYRSSATYEQLKEETAAALEAVAEVVDERDPSTAEHSERVARWVRQFTEAIGLPSRESARLIAAARLHDLGKIGVDVQTLAKTGRLDARELASIRGHPRLSARLLAPFHFAREMSRYVELHHERFDGHGYYGVPGEDVPIEAHVLIAADSLDAMTSARPYRPALSLEEAAAELRHKAGSHFQPDVAAIFAAIASGTAATHVLEEHQLGALRSSFSRIPVASIPDLRPVSSRILVLCLAVISLLVFGEDRIPLATRAAVVGAAVCVGAIAAVKAVLGLKRERSALRALDAGASPASVLAHAGMNGWLAVLEVDADGGGYVARPIDRTAVAGNDLREACSGAHRHGTAAYRAESGTWLVVRSREASTRVAAGLSRRPNARQLRVLQALTDRLAEATMRDTEVETGDAIVQATMRVELGMYEPVRRRAGQLVAEQLVDEAERRLNALAGLGGSLVRSGDDNFVVSVSVRSEDALNRLCKEVAAQLAQIPLPRGTMPISPRLRASVTENESVVTPLQAVG